MVEAVSMLNYNIAAAAKLGKLRNRMAATVGVNADQSEH
jgi:hypothetical protein